MKSNTMKTLCMVMVIIVFTLSLCGCAPKTVEDACKKADTQVAKWDDKSWLLCKYRSEYIENINGSATDVYAVFVTDLTYSDMSENGKTNTLILNPNKIYQELKAIFSGFDVSIAVMYCDDRGKLVYTMIDGEGSLVA